MLVMFVGGPMDGAEFEFDLEEFLIDAEAPLKVQRMVENEVHHYESAGPVSRWAAEAELRYVPKVVNCDCNSCQLVGLRARLEESKRALRRIDMSISFWVGVCCCAVLTWILQMVTR